MLLFIRQVSRIPGGRVESREGVRKVLRSHLIFHYWYDLHYVIDISLSSEYFKLIQRYK